MSESEKKEVAASAPNPTDQPADQTVAEFLEAVKERSDQGLKKASDVLRKDALTIRLKKEHIQKAAAAWIPNGQELPLEVKDTIELVTKLSKHEEFTCREFIQLIKLLEDPGEEDQKTKIGYKLKAAEEGECIVLSGETGVGKTLMAREVAASAVRNRDFDAAIWVFLNRIYDKFSLLESIAYQLNVLDAFEKSEAKAEEEAANKLKEKADETKKKKEAGNNDIVQVTEEERREEKLNNMIQERIKGKRLLIILDSDGRRMRAEVKKKKIEKSTSDEGEKKEKLPDSAEVEKEEESTNDKGENKTKQVLMNLILELKVGSGGGDVVIEVELQHLASYKVLMTRREINSQNNNEIMVKRFTWNDSKKLAKEREKLEENTEAGDLAHYFMFMSERVAAQLLLISRIVSYFAKEEEGLKKLRDDREMVRNSEEVKVLDVLIKGYVPKSILIDCYSPETPDEHFLLGGRKVNFNALICYWIMEGHLGHFHRVEDAYFRGHSVLMELMKCGLLQQQEADYVVASEATKFHIDIKDYKEFFSGIRSGLAVTFDMRLGRVALADGMIKSIGKSKLIFAPANGMKKPFKRSEVISALLLDGNRISEEESPIEILSKHKDEVQVLAIKDPTSQHFKLPILEMQKLRLLALRGCQFLNNLDHFLSKRSDQNETAAPSPEVPSAAAVDKLPPGAEVNPVPPTAIEMLHPKPEVGPEPPLASMAFEKLESLTFLEISGPSSFKTIHDPFFSLMPNLKTLNLSNLLKVESLPNSFYDLAQIEFLILRGCRSLKELKSIKNFKDLKVLDVSNATSFEKFEDKSFHLNSKLQILNLSKTKLKTLPLINLLKDLKFVCLRDCEDLPRIRKIDKMDRLMIFDIAGAAQVERFCDPSLEDLGNLVIVDISGTAIKRLPANIGDPTYLYAENCSKIRVVPPVEGLQKLQVLHLSGCERLRLIRDEFFEKVKVLRELDLSRTKVNKLPFLPSLTSLRRLLLSECELLEELKLSDLKELEHLDLSGCKALMELEGGTFDDMIHLKHLYLSGTGLRTLPSLSKLSGLSELHVRDCANLSELPGLENIPSLDVLDYSGTVLASPPKLSSSHPPRVFGAGIERIHPTQLFKSLGADLKQRDNQGPDWVFEHGEVSLCKWNISNWGMEAAEKRGTPVYGAHFLRLLKEYKDFLEENLSKFRFLVYPSELRLPDDFKASYSDKLSLRDIYFKQLWFPDDLKASYSDKLSVRDINFKQDTGKCLEIFGFKELPKSLKPLIEIAQFVVLVDDPFLSSLPDLGTKAMKACWIESCNELEHVVAVPGNVEKPAETTESGVEQKKSAAGKLEELKGEGNQQKKADAGKVGEPAKSDGDQQKNNVAPAETTKSQDDQKKNAVEDNSGEPAKSEGNQPENAAAAASDKSQESSQSEGDENKSAAAAATAPEKSPESSKIEGDEQKNAATATASEKSPESSKSEGDEQKNAATATASEKSPESSKSEGDDQKNAAAASEKSQESSKIEGDEQKNAAAAAAAGKSQELSKSEVDQQPEHGKTQVQDKLERLWISDVSKLKSILKGDIQSISFKLLTSLYLEYCPSLSALTSSSSQLQCLEALSIKYCQNLSRLFTDDNSPKLNNLRNLHLWGLDSLEKISCKAPSLKKLRVGQCRLLEHVITSRLGEDETENEGHNNLEVLHIKSCDNLSSICESSSDEYVMLERLAHLELSGLPKLKKVVQAVPTLSVLRVNDCPSLEKVVHGGNVPNLETMEVRSCETMRKIIDGAGPVLKKIEKVELVGLPMLESIGAELLKREGEQKQVQTWACPKLKLQYG